MEDDDIPQGYTRVTDILKPFAKFDNIPKETLDYAADRGTRVHKYCEMYANHLFIDDIDKDCENYVTVFKKWFDEYVEDVLFTEKRLNSKDLKITGKFDMIVRLKGDKFPTLIDIKTPATHSVSWALQTAAYKNLIFNEMDYTVQRRICLLLPKLGDTCRIVEYTEHERDTALFFSALELYRFFNG